MVVSIIKLSNQIGAKQVEQGSSKARGCIFAGQELSHEITKTGGLTRSMAFSSVAGILEENCDIKIAYSNKVPEKIGIYLNLDGVTKEQIYDVALRPVLEAGK